MIPIKLVHPSGIRRIGFPEGNTLENLVDLVRTLIPVECFALQYQDNEGDWVSFDSESEYQEALAVARAVGVLKIHIVKVKRQSAPPPAETLPKPAIFVPTVPPTTEAVPPPALDATPTTPVSPTSVSSFDADDRLSEPGWELVQEGREPSVEAPAKPERPPLPQAVFLEDVTLPDGSLVAIGEAFRKVWKIKNPADQWPQGISLRFLGGTQLGPEQAPVPSLNADEEVDLALDCVAPKEPGNYIGFWSLHLENGEPFGPRLWLKIVVPEPRQNKWAAQLMQLQELGFADNLMAMELLDKHDGDLTAVVEACIALC